MTATTGAPTSRSRVRIVDDAPALTEVLSVAVTEAGHVRSSSFGGGGNSSRSTSPVCAGRPTGDGHR